MPQWCDSSLLKEITKPMKKLTKIKCSLTKVDKEHYRYYVVTVPSKNILIRFNTYFDSSINRFLIKIIGDESEASSTFTYYSEEPLKKNNPEHHANKYARFCTPKLYNTAHKILTEISKDFKTISLLNPDLKDVQLTLYVRF